MTETEIEPLDRQFDFRTAILFSLVVGGTIIAVPTFAYFFGYSWFDWTMFFLLYIVSGLGITVGYHRLMAHRSFKCSKWVKGGLLIAGGLALQNSALKWAPDHIRHHARKGSNQGCSARFRVPL